MQNQRIEYDEHILNTPTVELLVALLCLSKTYDGGMCWSTALAARWFISLILSLAAALFSILARQWIREYLKWRSPLSEPRKNYDL